VWLCSPEMASAARGRAHVRSICVLAACSLALALGGVSPASAAIPYVEGTIRYLQEAQSDDGGFAGVPGGRSDPDMSAWAALGLASAGVNPQDQARPGGASVFTYLLAHASELESGNAECSTAPCTTELARTLLVVDAAGTSAHDFGGVDLETRVLERELPGGGFPHAPGGDAQVNDTEWSIMALSPLPDTAASTTRAAQWLIGEQDADGGWPATCPRSACPQAESEVDATSAAVEALSALRLEGAVAAARGLAVAQALEYLQKAQRAARDPGDPGGLPELPASETEANVASTAWGAQALWSDDLDPTTWAFEGGNPLTYMVSMQQPDGHIRYRASSDANPVWMTAYVLPALNGVQLPIVNVRRNAPSVPPSPQTRSGAAGVSPAGPSTGVLAGGGGAGAHDFSRPSARGRGRAAAHTPSVTSGGKRPRITDDSDTLPRSAVARRTNGRRATRLTQHQGEERGRASRAVVRGVLLAPHGRLAAAPPGLRGAPAGAKSSTSVAVALGIAAVAMAGFGAALERRRPARWTSPNGGVGSGAASDGWPA
jgi:prenyltransferase beta subunit